MSKENVKQLFEKARSHAPLLEKIQTAHWESMRVLAMDLAAISDHEGVAFTAEEFLDATKESASGLSDAQLEAVAGGKIAQSDVPDNMLSLLTALRATNPR